MDGLGFLYVVLCFIGLVVGAGMYDDRISKQGWSVLDIALAIIFLPTTIFLSIVVFIVTIGEKIQEKTQFNKFIEWLKEPIRERKKQK